MPSPPLDYATMSRFIISKSSLFNRRNCMQYTLQVEGMTCGHCERAVTQAVQQIDPAATVRIDRAQNRVDIDSTQPREALAAAIAEEGYQVAA
jgi:copper chaperone